MDKQFPAFIHNFVQQYNQDVFSNISKCKSLLLDHAKGEYKSEIRLLLQALDLGLYTTILNSKDLNLTRITLIKQLQNEYFISEEISSSLIDLLLLELKNYKSIQTENAGKSSKKKNPKKQIISNSSDSGGSASSRDEASGGRIAAGTELNTGNHTLVFIPPGTFTMGSSESESGYDDEGYETPHTVKLTKGLYMGKYQVTQELYQAVMGSNPSKFANKPAKREAAAKRPVECVSWYDALVFCNKLSVLEGLTPVYSIGGTTDTARWGRVPADYDNKWDAVVMNRNANGYRLPTEAEWEYACRAGTTTAYNTGNTISDNTGWYRGNSGMKTHEVGKKAPNAWGLYDMHGNVWEWCWDWYDENYYTDASAGTDPVGPASPSPELGSYRVRRGGGWYNDAQYLRSAYRYYTYPWFRGYNLGFRLVRNN